MTRLLPNGAPDPGFVADNVISSSMTRVTSVAIAIDGKLLVAGDGAEGRVDRAPAPTGERDSKFGDAGRTWIDLKSANVTSPIVRDMAVRGDGSVIVAGGDTNSDRPFVVRLLGDGGGVSRGILSFSRWHAAPQESAGKAILRVRRSGGSDGIVSARFFTVAELEALENEDFVPKSGILRWAAGDRSEKAIVIELADGGTSPEYLESFRVVLEGARGGSGLGRRWATVDIQPDGSPGGPD